MFFVSILRRIYAFSCFTTVKSLKAKNNPTKQSRVTVIVWVEPGNVKLTYYFRPKLMETGKSSREMRYK